MHDQAELVFTQLVGKTLRIDGGPPSKAEAWVLRLEGGGRAFIKNDAQVGLAASAVIQQGRQRGEGGVIWIRREMGVGRVAGIGAGWQAARAAPIKMAKTIFLKDIRNQ